MSQASRLSLGDDCVKKAKGAVLTPSKVVEKGAAFGELLPSMFFEHSPAKIIKLILKKIKISKIAKIIVWS